MGKNIPLFSIIIPVYNESGGINRQISHLLSIKKQYSIEIIVIDGNIENTTLKSIHNTGVIKISSERGRSIQMNTGAKESGGEILIFLHCDTELPGNALDEIRNALSINGIKAGAFDLEIDSKRTIFRIIERVSSLRSRITRVPYGDQVFFTTREYFFEIGGFSEIPLMEDVDIMERIKKRKDKIFIIPESVKTSARKWKKEGIIFSTLRNWLLITSYHLGVSPEKLVRLYYRNY